MPFVSAFDIRYMRSGVVVFAAVAARHQGSASDLRYIRMQRCGLNDDILSDVGWGLGLQQIWRGLPPRTWAFDGLAEQPLFAFVG